MRKPKRAVVGPKNEKVMVWPLVKARKRKN
jgi:hypothetical protein